MIAFATAGYDQDELLGGIRDVAGGAPLAGCSASGVITSAGADEMTHAVAVMSLASDWLTLETFSVDRFSEDAGACGRGLADQIAARGGGPGRLLMLFPDGLTGNVSDLLGSLHAALPYPLTVVGGSAGELLKTDRTWQYHDGVARSDSVSAVLLGGDFAPEVVVTHGCRPIGTEQTITRAENGWIQEIDGRPAWDVYREYLDSEDLEKPSMAHFCYLCLAVKLPQPDPEYGEHVIRCPLRFDRKSGALFFPGNIATGSRVRMALRDPELIRERARTSAQALMARHGGQRPAMVFQFDCCCRGRLLFGTHTSETCILPVQSVFGPSVPWLGLHTYGEISPLAGGEALYHNYSLVLCALFAGEAPGGERAALAH